MSKSRMFPFITDTWNPAKGCNHLCSYCWAREYAKRIYTDKFALKLYPERLHYKKKHQFVFVCDMGDIGCFPQEWVLLILGAVDMADKSNTFLFLTKNPQVYLEHSWPNNCILGCTIETNREDLIAQVSKAPSPLKRMAIMHELPHPTQILISIEPIMDFDGTFMDDLIDIGPQMVAVGAVKSASVAQQVEDFTSLSKTVGRWGC